MNVSMHLRRGAFCVSGHPMRRLSAMSDHIQCNHTFRIERRQQSGWLELRYRGDQGWESLSCWPTYAEAVDAMHCFVPGSAA